MQPFISIRPREAEESSDGDATLVQRARLPETAPPKRRRVTVNIACNTCRRRKVKCDGRRPNCSNCEGTASICNYRDDSELSQESQQLLLELIRLLNTVPDDEAIKKLRALKQEIDTSVILRTLRNNEDGGAELAVPDQEISATKQDTFIVAELASQHATAYPTQTHINLEALQRATYQQLIQSRDMQVLGVKKVKEVDEDDGKIAELCDPRLAQVDFSKWTTVPIASDLAARAISAYLETDHPLLQFFEPNLFLADLVHGEANHCSSLLVNSLLYWACQINYAQDKSGHELSLQLCAEAERLWEKEKDVDSMLKLTAAQFLSLGYVGQGRDHAVLAYLREASEMAMRLGAFGVDNDRAVLDVASLSTNARRAYIHAAWGAFNWATYMSLFFRQPGLPCPKCEPKFPMPERRKTSDDTVPSPRIDYTGAEMFPHLCEFWSIVREVASVYTRRGGPPPADQKSLRFAEYKFRELLAWSNGLPANLSPDKSSLHYVQVLHIWLHAAILDVFRHIDSSPIRYHRLRTFTSTESSASKACRASVHQLKYLIVNYRLNFTSSSQTILWHMALTYLANALLYQRKDEDWMYYFLLCVYGYERLRPHWRVTRTISKALLSLALKKGDISSLTARRVLSDVESDAVVYSTFEDEDYGEGIRATFMMDLNQAKTDPHSAMVEQLADDFEDNLDLQQYTTAFDTHDA